MLLSLQHLHPKRSSPVNLLDSFSVVFPLLSRTAGPRVFLYPLDLLPFYGQETDSLFQRTLHPLEEGQWHVLEKTQKSLEKTYKLTHPVTLYSSASHPTTKNSQQVIIWPLFSWYRYRLQVVYTFNEVAPWLHPLVPRAGVLPIDDHLATKEPMSAVLRVSLPVAWLTVPSLKLRVRLWKFMVGRLLSFWEDLLSGAKC